MDKVDIDLADSRALTVLAKFSQELGAEFTVQHNCLRGDGTPIKCVITIGGRAGSGDTLRDAAIDCLTLCLAGDRERLDEAQERLMRAAFRATVSERVLRELEHG